MPRRFHNSMHVAIPTFSHFVGLSNIFQRCFPLQSFQLSRDDLFWFLSSHNIAKKDCLAFTYSVYDYMYMNLSDLVIVSASRNTISCDFSAVHEFCSILGRNHIFVSSSFLRNCFVIVPVIAFIHQNGFNTAPQGSPSCVKIEYLMILKSKIGSSRKCPFLI